MTTIDEATELFTTILAVPAGRATACRGWTAHDLVAHLAAGAAEQARLIEGMLAGGGDEPTRGFEEREGPFRELPDGVLRGRLLEESIRFASALELLGSRSVRFTGLRMDASAFRLHARSECAIHRWDLVGMDEVGRAMLGQPELTRHAVCVLTGMAALQETLAGRLSTVVDGDERRVVIRSLPDDDVVIAVGRGRCDVTIEPPADVRADLELDAAQRLLVLWGRREAGAPIVVGGDDGSRPIVEALVGAPMRAG